MIDLHHSDCIEWLKAYDGPLFDSAVTDPPYHLTSIVKRFGGANAAEAKVGATGAYARASRGFMGKEWDGGDVAFRPETWRAVYDALKPGAHLVAFSGTRTYHRMACAIEDAGFEIRDCLMWCYGQGFPKSHDVSKGLDKSAGHWRGKAGAVTIAEQVAKGTEYERTDKGEPVTAAAAAWQGWGTALKPALEPICLARKPLSEKSVAANVLKHGTGAINVDACRVEAMGRPFLIPRPNGKGAMYDGGIADGSQAAGTTDLGRWPANLIHDGSDEVLAGFPDAGGEFGVRGESPNWGPASKGGGTMEVVGFGDTSSAARFFYSAKAGPLDRIGTSHATVKPVDVMRWLCRLVTPTGGHILEPFAGSGTTGIAAMAEGFDCTMIELMADHITDIERKLAYLRGEGAMSFVEHDRRRDEQPAQDSGPLFAGAAA